MNQSIAKPKVTIGMPVYNGEPYVHDALQSLLRQTYSNFELIISDNSSTDGTERICRQFARSDSRVRYIKQASNVGATANFGFLVDEACGDYFMWAAHDDIWRHDYLARAVQSLDATGAGFAFPTFEVRSIRLGIYTRPPAHIFEFIENTSAATRVLRFANLHHFSYKNIIVYSLFRTALVRAVHSRQDLSNEGVMCMVLLNSDRGAIVEGHRLSKRYRSLWPGFWTILLRGRTSKADSPRFIDVRDRSFHSARALFPDIGNELDMIYQSYHQHRFHAGFRILEKCPSCHR